MADDAEVQETIGRAVPSLLPMFALLTPVERADLWHALPCCSLAEALVHRVCAPRSALPSHADCCARRYVAVYERGGWYVDSDASCVRPFDQWTPPGERADLVVGVEAERWPGHYQPVQVRCPASQSQEEANVPLKRMSGCLSGVRRPVLTGTPA